MPASLRIAVIADDLTGANATGALLRGLGLRTLTLLEPSRLGELTADTEALAIDAST